MPTNKKPNSSAGTGTIPKSNLSVHSGQNLNDNINYVQIQESSPNNVTRFSNNEDNSRTKQRRTDVSYNSNGRQSTPSIDGNIAQSGDTGQKLSYHNDNSIQNRYLQFR